MKNSYKYDDSTNVLVSMIYFGIVIFMSVILVVWAITKKCQYCKQLKGREEQLKSLLDNMNCNVLAPYQIRAVPGKYGAWIELQFLNFNNKMIQTGETNLVNERFASNSPIAPRPVVPGNGYIQQSDRRYCQPAQYAPIQSLNTDQSVSTPFDL